MQILIIDNGTSYLSKLENLLESRNFRTIKFSDITSNIDENFDVVILSGGHNFPVLGNESRLENEIEFIKNCRKPIFGICFGFELVAHVFDAKLELMQNKEKGVIEIEVIEPDELFLNINKFNVFESHRWVVSDGGQNFKSLARSKDGIEAIKHKNLPIYGVQFHPEMFTEETCGDQIVFNFLELVDNS